MIPFLPFCIWFMRCWMGTIIWSLNRITSSLWFQEKWLLCHLSPVWWSIKLSIIMSFQKCLSFSTWLEKPHLFRLNWERLNQINWSFTSMLRFPVMFGVEHSQIQFKHQQSLRWWNPNSSLCQRDNPSFWRISFPQLDIQCIVMVRVLLMWQWENRWMMWNRWLWPIMDFSHSILGRKTQRSNSQSKPIFTSPVSVQYSRINTLKSWSQWMGCMRVNWEKMDVRWVVMWIWMGESIQ